eukprot:scaffold60149_cov29-Phaeocystis_antarctica.AAC.1
MTVCWRAAVAAVRWCRCGGAHAGVRGGVRQCTGLLTCLGRPFVLGRTLDLRLLDPIPPCLRDVSGVKRPRGWGPRGWATVGHLSFLSLAQGGRPVTRLRIITAQQRRSIST